MSGMVLLVAIWKCMISYKNGYTGLTVSASLAASLAALAHCRNEANLSLLLW